MRIYYLLFIVFIFFLTSCGTKKKTINRSPSHTHSTSIKKNKNKAELETYYADMLGVNKKDLNLALYSYIDDWMGVPHRLGGMTTSGIDCSGFVSLVYSNVYGKELPRQSKDMALNVKRKYEKQLKEGDLLFFSFGGKIVDHVGIYLSNDKFVHVSTTKGVIVSNLKDNWYYKYFVRCGTPK